MATVASVQPINKDIFWVRYSNLLLGVWSVPGLLDNLKNDPPAVLNYFELGTVPGAKFEITTEVDPEHPNFDGQFEAWVDGHSSGKYLLVVPAKYPGIEVQNPGDASFVAADTTNCCCCSCCPCCSCF